MTDKSNYIQSECFEGGGDRGSKFIKTYDNMSPRARDAIRNSKHNLCAACLCGQAGRFALGQYPFPDHAIIRAIEHMEEEIDRLDREKPGFVPPLPPMNCQSHR